MARVRVTLARSSLTLGLVIAFRAALLAWLPLSVACSIPLEDLASGPVNACDDALECGAGATCADVGTGRACVTTSASLKGLILEVRPAAASRLGAEVSYLIDLAGQQFELPFQKTSGHVHSFDPRVPAGAHVDGTLDLTAVSYCDGWVSGGDFPVTVTFRRVAPFPGLPDQEYSTTSAPDGPGHQKFEIELPTGDYDIHLLPQQHEACAEVPPPIFLPNQHVPERRTLSIVGTAPQVLQGTIEVPQNVSIDGWSIDAVEPVTGRVISQVATLAQSASQTSADFLIKYYSADPNAFAPLIRLRPKDGDPRPTVYWDVSALALQGSTANIRLTLSQLQAVARRVEGRTLDAGGNPVLATIRIQSAKIAGEVANAAYKLQADTDANGIFRVDLPPGDYRIFARPISDTTKATAETGFKLPEGSGCFCGQSIIIPSTGTLRGSVHGPAGESMDGAEIFAVPATTDPTTYLGRVLGPDPLLPRQASTTLVSDVFAFGADPGEFNFSVRPPRGSVYPWFVLWRLGVPSVYSAPITDLGPRTVSYPAVLQGVVRDGSNAPLGDTMVRAWLPVADSSAPDKVAGVIQIGETRSGPDGAYVLPLPPSASQGKSE
jgi:hypothetical protein